MKMHILMGCSGSGKSTFAMRMSGPAVVLSTDDHVWGGENRDIFLPHKLSQAHGNVFAAAIQHIRREQLRPVENLRRDLVIDNTNTTLVEIAPYVLLCQAYGVEPMFHLFGQSLSVEECFQRVQERGYHPVPKEVIYRQALNLQETLANWPLFWPPSPFWNNDRNP